MLAGHLVSNITSMNCVKAILMHTVKAYVWSRGTAPLFNQNMRKTVANFTNDDTPLKRYKTLSTAQCTVHSTVHWPQQSALSTAQSNCPQHIAISSAHSTVHSTVHCPQHSALSTAQCTVHKQEQQPNPLTTPAVLKVQHHSYWNMTSRRSVSITHFLKFITHNI